MSDSKGWVVLTGASGGIGKAFAVALARRGHPALLVARNTSKLEALARDIRADGGQCEVMAADISTEAGLDSLAERARTLGQVDLLVNNAGVSRTGPFLSQTAADESMMTRLNIDAVTALTRLFLPAMVARDGGGIINIASVVGFQPVPYWTTYAATKAYVLAFGQGLAHELRNSKVRVLTVCPGFTKTGLYDESGAPGLAGKVLPFATTDDVVAGALKAYERGRVVHVVGHMNRLLTGLGPWLPRRLLRWFMGALFAPSSPPSAVA
ncbi:MAG: SDR family oxidoreductase [Pseudomonadota bacterium]